MEPITAEDIKTSFADDEIEVVTNSDELKLHLEKMDRKNKVFLMMSSANFGGIDLNELFT